MCLRWWLLKSISALSLSLVSAGSNLVVLQDCSPAAALVRLCQVILLPFSMLLPSALLSYEMACLLCLVVPAYRKERQRAPSHLGSLDKKTENRLPQSRPPIQAPPYTCECLHCPSLPLSHTHKPLRPLPQVHNADVVFYNRAYDPPGAATDRDVWHDLTEAGIAVQEMDGSSLYPPSAASGPRPSRPLSTPAAHQRALEAYCSRELSGPLPAPRRMAPVPEDLAAWCVGSIVDTDALDLAPGALALAGMGLSRKPGALAAGVMASLLTTEERRVCCGLAAHWKPGEIAGQSVLASLSKLSLSKALRGEPTAIPDPTLRERLCCRLIGLRHRVDWPLDGAFLVPCRSLFSPEIPLLPPFVASHRFSSPLLVATHRHSSMFVLPAVPALIAPHLTSGDLSPADVWRTVTAVRRSCKPGSALHASCMVRSALVLYGSDLPFPTGWTLFDQHALPVSPD